MDKTIKPHSDKEGVTPASKEPVSERSDAPTLPQQVSQVDFDKFVRTLSVVMRPVSTAPTLTPQNFLQQIVLYENGGTRRVYFWVAGTWRYAALT